MMNGLLRVPMFLSVILAVVVLAVSARADTVTIVNARSEAVAICVFRDHIQLNVNKPMFCRVLEPKKSVVWDRGKESYIYALSLSKPNTNNTFCKKSGVSIGPVLTIGEGAGCNLNVSSPKPPPPAWEIPPEPTRDPRVKILNQIGDTVKICIYKGALLVVPEICWTMKPKEQVFWDRKNDSSEVNVKFFKPGLIDGPFCKGSSTAHLKGIPELVTISPGCLLTVRNRAPAKPTPVKPPPAGPNPEPKVSIRVCNRNTDETVNFVIASLLFLDKTDADPIVLAEGWFRSEPGKCQDIDMVPRFKQWRGPAWAKASAGSYQFLIYGETGGVLNKTWEGDGEDPEYCVKLNGNFKYKQGTARKRQCLGANHDRVQMTQITNRDDNGNVSTFYWNF